MRMPMIVEFVGLPGAGKTTVAGAVVRLLRLHGASVTDRENIQRWLQNLPPIQKAAFTLYKPGRLLRTAIAAFTYSVSVRPITRDHVSRAARTPFYKPYLEHFLDRHACEVCVLDQWSLQELWSLHIDGSARRVDEPGRLVKALLSEEPLLYVFLRIAPAEAARRVASRSHGGSRFDGLDRHMTAIWFRQLSIAMEEVVATVAQERTVLELDANSPPHANAWIVSERIVTELRRGYDSVRLVRKKPSASKGIHA